MKLWMARFEAVRVRSDEAELAFRAADQRIDLLVAAEGYPALSEWEAWLSAKTALDGASQAWTEVARQKPGGAPG